MSLRFKVLGLLALMLPLGAVTDWSIDHWVMHPSFAKLERIEATKDLQRCVDAIERDLQTMAFTCADYSRWDAALQFLGDGNQTYIDENLSADVYDTLHVDFVGLFRADGTAAWSLVRDRHAAVGEDEEPPALSVAELPADKLPADHLLLRHPGADSVTRGILMTEQGPLLVVSTPITNTAQDLPVAGAMVMGRFLDAQRVAQFESLTSVALTASVLRGGASGLPGGSGVEPVALSGDQPATIRRVDRLVMGDVVLHDLYGRPAVRLSTRMPRSIMEMGWKMSTTSRATALGAVLLALTMLWLGLDRLVVSPLRKLTDHAAAVRNTDDLQRRVNLQRRDEIGALAREFDAMIGSLAESRARAAEAAHRAGMSEIATEVLHNVGNALNTVGVSAEAMDEKLRQRTPGLEQTLGVLRQHRDDLPQFLAQQQRGSKLVDFLDLAVRNLDADQNEMLTHVDGLRAKVADIRAIIATQQQYARRVSFVQEEPVQQVVEDALRICKLDRVSGLTVERCFADLPPIRVERTKLLQVLANLINNALDAMRAVPSDAHCLRLETAAGERGVVVIRVRDSGTGITPEARTKLFEYGFTTKATGHGYGLHYCANIIRQMGGSIAVDSGGPGQGACFTVTLPVESPVLADEATA